MTEEKVTINTKKLGRKVISATPSLSLDDLLDTIADIIIERLLEEKPKMNSV